MRILDKMILAAGSAKKGDLLRLKKVPTLYVRELGKELRACGIPLIGLKDGTFAVKVSDVLRYQTKRRLVVVPSPQELREFFSLSGTRQQAIRDWIAQPRGGS